MLFIKKKVYILIIGKVCGFRSITIWDMLKNNLPDKKKLNFFFHSEFNKYFKERGTESRTHSQRKCFI